MVELNPNHPTTKQLNDVWHTLCLLLMRKMNRTEVVVTIKDFHNIEPNSLCIVAKEENDGLHLKIMGTLEAVALAADEARKGNDPFPRTVL